MSVQGMANPFLQQLQSLQSSLPPSPPPGYAGRLIAQVVLCSVLSLSSLLYVIVATHDHIKRGKRITLFKLTKLRHGRLVTLNTLYLYVIIVGCGGLVLAAYTVEKYRVFFHGQPSKNLAIFGLLSWVPALLSGWCFVFSTTSAALMMSKTCGAWLGGSAAAIYAHNAILFLYPLVCVGSTTSLGYMSKKYSNQAADLLEEIVALLTQGAATVAKGQKVDLSILLSLQEKSAAIKNDQRMISHYGLAILVISVAEVFTFVLLTGASYTFVLLLRKQARWNASRGMISVQGASADGPSVSYTSRSDLPSPRSPASKGSTFSGVAGLTSPSFKKVQATADSGSSEETDRLARLSRNLSWSMPLTFAESFFFIIFGILAGTIVQTSRAWSLREFQMDAFTWVHCSIQTCIVFYFLANAVLRPGRFGRSMSSDKPGTCNLGSSQSRSRNVNEDFHVRMVPLNKGDNEKSGIEPEQASSFKGEQDFSYGSTISLAKSDQLGL